MCVRECVCIFVSLFVFVCVCASVCVCVWWVHGVLECLHLLWETWCSMICWMTAHVQAFTFACICVLVHLCMCVWYDLLDECTCAGFHFYVHVRVGALVHVYAVWFAGWLHVCRFLVLSMCACWCISACVCVCLCVCVSVCFCMHARVTGAWFVRVSKSVCVYTASRRCR